MKKQNKKHNRLLTEDEYNSLNKQQKYYYRHLRSDLLPKRNDNDEKETIHSINSFSDIDMICNNIDVTFQKKVTIEINTLLLIYILSIYYFVCRILNKTMPCSCEFDKFESWINTKQQFNKVSSQNNIT